MTREQIKTWLLENIFSSPGKINKSRVTAIYFKDKPEYLNAINCFSPAGMPDHIGAKIYCIVNDILEYPKCICGQNLSWQRTKFSKFCCSTCANRHTFKTGKDAHIAKPEVKEKIKETLIAKYGVDNVFKLDSIKEQIKNTNIEKYGGQPAMSPVVREKAKQTSIKRYGVEHYSKTQKHHETMIDYNQRYISKEVLEKTYDKQWLRNQHHDEGKTLSEIAKDLGVSFTLIWERFNKFEIPINHTFSVSATEHDIENFLTEHGLVLNKDFLRNKRDVIPPKELDFYFPNNKLAIEYNGIYFHTTQYVEKNHHLDKTRMCENRGIQLIHLYETEWRDKQNICKSMILNRLGKTQRIYARKCQIVELDDAKDFLNNNHIQGFCHAAINLGLKHNEELVALMTFSKSRFNQNYEWELVRFCNKLDTTVTGGAGKLLSYFCNQERPNSIISYADRRYSNGNLYKKLGFQHIHTTPPNYDYVIGDQIQSRHLFKKMMLKSKLPKFDPNLTEEQNMINAGYHRIYDCGQMAFVWKNLDNSI